MMSVDTNVLLAAVHPEAPGHAVAAAFLAGHVDGSDVAISELALMELYCLLRNPAVVARPASAAQARGVIERLRSHPLWLVVDHVPDVMDAVWAVAGRDPFPRRRIYDLRLALGLLHHGVTRFATRNVRDFEGLGFSEVVDPFA